jgi:hypothetical protein
MANRMALKVAPDIEQAIQDGTLSMADCESAAYFVQECILDHLLDGKVMGVSTHNFSDNTPDSGMDFLTHQWRTIPIHRGDASLPRHLPTGYRKRTGRLHPLAWQGKPPGRHPFELI